MSDRTTSHAQRVAIIERHQQGETLVSIAHNLSIGFYTVRKWWRAYRDHGWEALIPRSSGAVAQGALSQFDKLVKFVALKLKRQHPGWGLDKLLLEMSRRASLKGQTLPKRSAVYNYLKQFYPRLREHRPSRTQRPTSHLQRATAAHACWQIDFKGEEDIPGCGLVKPFMVCDEYSSAPLAGIIHSGKRGAVKMAHVQDDLRQVFSQWGLPDKLRMDRDPTWVGSSRLEFPSRLMLWLVGLGIIPSVNRAHRPTDNAQVERCNGIWLDHVARGLSSSSLQALQELTDQAWHDRREHLPSYNPHCHGQAPFKAIPSLSQPRRPFSEADELDLFDIQRVYDYLRQWQWERKVDSRGQISLGGYNHRVSHHHCGQIVKVHFDVSTQLFVACAVDGTELRQFSLPSIETHFILGRGT